MVNESKLNDPTSEQVTAAGGIEESQSSNAQVESQNENEQAEDRTAGSGPAAKKKKSKKKRIKAALGVGPSGSSVGGGSREDITKALSGLSNEQASELLKMNPALATQLGVGEGTSSSQAEAALKKLGLEDVMTGLASEGKNVKDMASYKFWKTQPVPKFGEKTGVIVEGPFKIVDPAQVPKEPGPLVDGFEWVTMDLTSDDEIKEVFELLYGHYVEDDEAMFRFNYSKSFLKWALLSPGWTREWHVGVRASTSRKLVAFISAVPVALRVRQKTLRASEVNFLCIHKKLRGKRLAPVLIKEITRRCYLLGTWQAIYTGGVVLPKAVSTCRYFHRSIDWQKLNDVNFSPLPANSKPSYQIQKYKLPDQISTKGLRPMEEKDIDDVLDLLKRYLAKFDMAPVFTREEVDHWLLHKKAALEDQVVWSYVVEDSSTHKITDFFSFYNLESSVIGNKKHTNVRAAYLFYCATETSLSFPPTPTTSLSAPLKEALKIRYNELINDALILAKKYEFDVFNALTLMDNNMFLEQQKFGAGDGQLHYYLYNYNANPIAGGVDHKNRVDDECSGIGVVML